jgi:hypothetical protein
MLSEFIIDPRASDLPLKHPGILAQPGCDKIEEPPGGRRREAWRSSVFSPEPAGAFATKLKIRPDEGGGAGVGGRRVKKFRRGTDGWMRIGSRRITIIIE